MKRSFLIRAATAMAVAVCPAAAMTVPALSVSAAATTTAITLKPTAGPPTTKVTVNGTGFGPAETVTVDFDTTLAATATTSAAGSFTTPLTVPAAALPGQHTVTATGQASSLSASAPFLVRANWPKFRFSNGNSGFNRYENVLSPATVGGLTLAWSHSLRNRIFSSPAVVGGVVYVGSAAKRIYALKASTGAQLWSYFTDADVASPTVANGAVYQAGYALNASTGALLWSSPALARNPLRRW